MHLAFIDFSKAFDNVNRNILYEKIISHGISSKFLKIMESMCSKIRTSNGSSGTFSQKYVVMQGESLSPSLF